MVEKGSISTKPSVNIPKNILCLVSSTVNGILLLWLGFTKEPEVTT